MTTRVETKARVRCYEVNGEDVAPSEDEFLTVETHWNSEDRVVLKRRGGRGSLTVVADDLRKAIDRCSRCRATERELRGAGNEGLGVARGSQGYRR